ncbi:MAG: hypothetical protein ACRCW3_01530, partial [Metamycoplasmataceae bacterium]
LDDTTLNVEAKKEDIILSKSDVEGNKYKELPTLRKLFNIPNDEDFNKFDAKVDKEDFTGSGTTHIITLTAKDNFTFADGKVITKEFNLETVLNIKPIKLNSLILSREDVEENLNTFETLSKLFGLSQEDVNEKKVTATLIGTPGNATSHTISLKTKEGFIFFNDKYELISDSFTLETILTITRVESDPQNITHLDLQNIGYKTIDVLEKLFLGIKPSDLNFIDIKITDLPDNGVFEFNKNYIITITAINGYIFNDVNGKETRTLSSVSFKTVAVMWDISSLPNPSIENKDVEELKNANDIVNDKVFKILEKLFSGSDFNKNNLIGVSFHLNEPTTGNNNYSVELTFENWIQINNTLGNIIESEPFTLKTVISGVVIKDNITNVSITRVELDKILNKNDNDINGKITILLKLFNGINTNNFDLFEISEIENNNEIQIKLSAMSDQVFIENGSEVEAITSGSFKITETLQGEAKSGDIFLDISDVESNKYSSFATLEKLFNNLVEGDLDNGKFTVAINSQNFVGGTIYTITLRAQDGFIFSADKEISKTFTLNNIALAITRVESDPNNITKLDLKGYETIKVLGKLFNGIKDTDLQFIETTITGPSNNGEFEFDKEYMIKIKTIDGYIFSDAAGNQNRELTSITFKTVAVTLDISALTNPVLKNSDFNELDTSDMNSIDKANLLIILEKLFTGTDLTIDNIDNILEYTAHKPASGNTEYSVDLRFKDGFQIMNLGFPSNLIDSNSFTLKTIVNIKIRTGTIGTITQLDFNKMLNPLGDKNGQALALNKLFTGVNTTNLDLFQISEGKNGLNEWAIILTLSDGDSAFINEAGEEDESITSRSFKITLDVTAIPTPGTFTNAEVDSSKLNMQDPGILVLLQKFFVIDDVTNIVSATL